MARWSSASLVLLSFLFGLFILAMLISAPPAHAGRSAWPKLHAPDFALTISKTPLDAIPIDPDAAGTKAMKWASLQARSESSFWRYIQERQTSIAWFLVRIEPSEESEGFVWRSADRLIFVLADSTRLAAELVTATRCHDVDSPCELQRMPANLEWSDFATAKGWRAYAGVPRDAIRAHGVLGVSLEVSP